MKFDQISCNSCFLIDFSSLCIYACFAESWGNIYIYIQQEQLQNALLSDDDLYSCELQTFNLFTVGRNKILPHIGCVSAKVKFVSVSVSLYVSAPVPNYTVIITWITWSYL